MSLSLEEVNETQQLMQNEIEEDEQKAAHPATSITSAKLSSGAPSLSSKNPAQTVTSTGNIYTEIENLYSFKSLLHPYPIVIN